MPQFRVFFAHIPPVTVDAASGESARAKGAAVAKLNETLVTKVKRVKEKRS